VDADGAGIRRKARGYFGFKVDDVRVIRVLTIDAHLGPEQFEQIRTEIFTNPVTEESSYSPITREFDWLIWIGFRPGVRDTAGSTAGEAVEDLLGIDFKPGEAILYLQTLLDRLKGALTNNRSIRSRATCWPMRLSSSGRYSRGTTGGPMRGSVC